MKHPPSLEVYSSLLNWSNSIYVIGAILTLFSACAVLYERRAEKNGTPPKWGYLTSVVVIVAAFISLTGTVGAIVFGSFVINIKDKQLSSYEAGAKASVAEAEKIAAQANLRAEQIRREYAGRSLSVSDANRLVVSLRGFTGKVTVDCLSNDPESTAYALEMNIVLRDAGAWAGPVHPQIGTFFFGVDLQGPPGVDLGRLKAAMSVAGVQYTVAAAPNLTIFVGAKRPTFLLNEEVPH